MRSRRMPWLFAGLCSLMLVSGGTSPAIGGEVEPAGLVAFPSLVIIRGGDLARPVVLTHRGAVGMDIRGSAIANVYGGLRPVTRLDLLRLRMDSYYEVAEFHRVLAWVHGPFDSTGRLIDPPPFDSATHFSKLYPAVAGRPVIWDEPATRPGGGRGRFWTLSDTAQRTLRNHGIVLR